MSTAPAQTSDRIYTLRLPKQLDRQVEAVAVRDGNPLSATIRRLISLGLRAEESAANERRG
jgi:hypothetical protein